MPNKDVFFTTSDVTEVAKRLTEVTADYEALFNNLCKQIFTTIKDLPTATDEVAVTLQYVKDASLAFTNNFPDQYSPACGKGCGHCCNFPIDAPPQVVEDIATYLESTYSQDGLEELKHKLISNIEQRKPPHFRAPCPFLDESQSCSIYEKRPLACRWFMSPDVNLCIQSVESGQNIPQHPVHSRIYEAAATALLAVEQKRSEQGLQVKFIPSLLERLTR